MNLKLLSFPKLKASGQSGAINADGVGNDKPIPSALDILYLVHIVTPAKTAITSPLVTVLSLPICETMTTWVQFPLGCDGLAGVSFFRYSRQIFPLPTGTWLIMNGQQQKFKFREVLDTNPFSIEIRTYNTDDLFSHTISVGFEVIPVQKVALHF